jgi:signal transduction histidine kinase/CheY-like chemotaxis protein
LCAGHESPGAEPAPPAEPLLQSTETVNQGLELTRTRNELVYQLHERDERASELVVANTELRFQTKEKAKRASELVIANTELRFQTEEKAKRASELVIANTELRFQTEEKAKRAAELMLANQELGFQKREKGKRAAELVFAYKDLLFQKERSRLQAQLQQSQRLESLGTLAGGVAHDMNNVLAAILGLAEVHLVRQPAGSPIHQAFEIIAQAAVRGGKLVKSLLTFAHQSSSERLELDLNATLRDEIRLLACTSLVNVHLEVDLAPDLRPIHGDAGALTHALMNLCINAADAMSENGTLRLSTRNVDPDWVEVMVEDTGSGMSKEILDKALDPFFTTKEVGKGTGLGLSTVYATVKAHGGHLDIHSEPGVGTRVSLRFPACSQARVAAVEPRGTHVEPFQGPLTVLVVDDDDLVQNSMRAMLDLLGHSVIAARSGEEAVAKLEARFQPDLVILDMNMPGLGGSRTLPRLRALLPKVPVLVATGRPDQSAMNLVEGQAHVTLLPKPFGLADLRQYLGSLERMDPGSAKPAPEGST